MTAPAALAIIERDPSLEAQHEAQPPTSAFDRLRERGATIVEAPDADVARALRPTLLHARLGRGSLTAGVEATFGHMFTHDAVQTDKQYEDLVTAGKRAQEAVRSQAGDFYCTYIPGRGERRGVLFATIGTDGKVYEGFLPAQRASSWWPFATANRKSSVLADFRSIITGVQSADQPGGRIVENPRDTTVLGQIYHWDAIRRATQQQMVTAVLRVPGTPAPAPVAPDATLPFPALSLAHNKQTGRFRLRNGTTATAMLLNPEHTEFDVMRNLARYISVLGPLALQGRFLREVTPRQAAKRLADPGQQHNLQALLTLLPTGDEMPEFDLNTLASTTLRERAYNLLGQPAHSPLEGHHALAAAILSNRGKSYAKRLLPRLSGILAEKRAERSGGQEQDHTQEIARLRAHGGKWLAKLVKQNMKPGRGGDPKTPTTAEILALINDPSNLHERYDQTRWFSWKNVKDTSKSVGVTAWNVGITTVSAGILGAGYIGQDMIKIGKVPVTVGRGLRSIKRFFVPVPARPRRSQS